MSHVCFQRLHLKIVLEKYFRKKKFLWKYFLGIYLRKISTPISGKEMEKERRRIGVHMYIIASEKEVDVEIDIDRDVVGDING